MGRPRKRRFGVSIPSDLADDLEKLAKALGTDRSSIVRDALREYIHDHMHYLVPHECSGVMILMGNIDHERLHRVIEEFRDIIHSYNHTHVAGICIEILIVSGPSPRITLMHRTLVETKGCIVRYVPIKYCPVEGGSQQLIPTSSH